MKAYEGKYFAFIGTIRWLLTPYANNEGRFNFKQKSMVIKVWPWSDLLEWLMFCRGQGLLTRDLSSFFYSSHSLRVFLLITCILLFHCEYSPSSRTFHSGTGSARRACLSPPSSSRAWPLIPGLFPSSRACSPHRQLDPLIPGLTRDLLKYNHRGTEP